MPHLPPCRDFIPERDLRGKLEWILGQQGQGEPAGGADMQVWKIVEAEARIEIACGGGDAFSGRDGVAVDGLPSTEIGLGQGNILQQVECGEDVSVKQADVVLRREAAGEHGGCSMRGALEPDRMLVVARAG